MNLTMNSGSQLSRMLYQSYLVPVLSLAGCYPLMQVRWVDQTQYPMIVVASLSAVPQSCRTPLPNQYLDCMLLAVYTHTPLLCRYAICPFASCKHPGIAVKATELMPDTRTDPRNNICPTQACHEPRIPQSNCYYAGYLNLPF